MCVIIHRSPNVTIPTEKIEIACDVNKHGFGIAYPEKGKLVYIRSIKEPNDPKIVCDHLQKLKDKQVFLHLRHATVGKVTLENNHPFVALSYKRNGMDLAWMHNGTLWDWKPTNENESDTHLFHTTLMQPLAHRIYKFAGKKLLEDHIFRRVIQKEVGYTHSVFVIFDGSGNHLIFGKDKGVQFAGWWASNDESFRTTHVRATSYHAQAMSSTANNRQFFDPWSGYGDYVDPWEDQDPVSDPAKKMYQTWEDDLREADLSAQAANAEANEKALTVSQEGLQDNTPKNAPTDGAVDEKRVGWECDKVRELVYQNTLRGSSSNGRFLMQMEAKDLAVYKRSFLSMSGLPSLDALGRLTERDLVDCILRYPHAMGRAIIDLLAEIKQNEQRIERQAKLITEQQQHKAQLT